MSTQFVFDVPAAPGPYFLHVDTGSPVERAFEAVLIGDEDSLLRPGPRMALTSPS
jgi:hypothetical protein